MVNIIDGSTFKYNGNQYGVSRTKTTYIIRRWTNNGWQKVTTIKSTNFENDSYPSENEVVEYCESWVHRNF